MTATQNIDFRYVIPTEAAFTATGPLGCPINPYGAASLWGACREVVHDLRMYFAARRRGH